jgi:peptidylprolyl isomerase domain and WD repeat-containing protein 1
MAASENPLFRDSESTDPTLFGTAYKKNRFYLFSTREPSGTGTSSNRDIFNEKPSREEQTVATATIESQAVGKSATIHTSYGDMTVRLYPDEAPLAVKNFLALAKSGYYEGVIFHRVIKGFMCQTGDPNGGKSFLNLDGTGGLSSYAGKEFEDEFHPNLRHDRPYTISMANAGPNTNASQFFITTAPTAWLDDKHTIFGRVTAGTDVVQRIEISKVDRRDRPVVPIRILKVDMR